MLVNTIKAISGGGSMTPILDTSTTMGGSATVHTSTIKADDATFIVAYFRLNTNYVYPVIADVSGGTITIRENQIITVSKDASGYITFSSTNTTTTNGKTLYVIIY